MPTSVFGSSKRHARAASVALFNIAAGSRGGYSTTADIARIAQSKPNTEERSRKIAERWLDFAHFQAGDAPLRYG
jgi:hypothetical protein